MATVDEHTHTHYTPLLLNLHERSVFIQDAGKELESELALADGRRCCLHVCFPSLPFSQFYASLGNGRSAEYTILVLAFTRHLAMLT